MKDWGAADELFTAGDCGSTITVNLLRSLALRDFDEASVLLDCALKHDLIKSGIRVASRGGLLADLENSFERTDEQLEYQHVRLVIRSLETLRIDCDSRLKMLLIARAYAAGDSDAAEQMADEALKNPANSLHHDLICRVPQYLRSSELRPKRLSRCS